MSDEMKDSIVYRQAYGIGMKVWNDEEYAKAFAESKYNAAYNPKPYPFPPDSWFDPLPKRRPTDEELEGYSFDRQRK